MLDPAGVGHAVIVNDFTRAILNDHQIPVLLLIIIQSWPPKYSTRADHLLGIQVRAQVALGQQDGSSRARSISSMIAVIVDCSF